jgi:hypothetical protein
MFFEAVVHQTIDSEYVISYKTNSTVYTKKEKRIKRTLKEYQGLQSYLKDHLPFYILSTTIEKLFSKISIPQNDDNNLNTESRMMSRLPRTDPADTLHINPRTDPTDTLQINPSTSPADTLHINPRTGPADTLHINPRTGPADTLQINESEFYIEVIESIGMIKFLETDFEFTPPKLPKIEPQFQLFTKTKEIDDYFPNMKKALEESIKLATQVGKSSEQLYIRQVEMKKIYEKFGITKIGNPLPFSKVLSFVIKSILDDIDWIKRALEFRFILLGQYESVCKETAKKVSQMEKMKSSVNINQEAVDSVLNDLRIIKENETAKKYEFNKVSFVLKIEIERWLVYKDSLLEEWVNRYIEESIK